MELILLFIIGFGIGSIVDGMRAIRAYHRIQRLLDRH